MSKLSIRHHLVRAAGKVWCGADMSDPEIQRTTTIHRSQTDCNGCLRALEISLRSQRKASSCP